MTNTDVPKGMSRLFLSAVFSVVFNTVFAYIEVSSNGETGGITLRAAIVNLANNGDTIRFAPALSGDTIKLTNGYITISKRIFIHGSGTHSTIISPSGNSRIFRITAGDSVSIEYLTLVNGREAADSGGAIYSTVPLNMKFCVLKNNTAAHAGAVLSKSSLTITGCTFTGNVATASFGGGIFSAAGSVFATDCDITGNTSVSGGGGIACNGSCTFIDVAFSGNFSNVGGGIYALSALNMTRCLIEGNNANFGHGGGIYNAGSAKLTECVISGNRTNNGSFHGGGIYNRGTFFLTACAVGGNSSAGMGGGTMSTATITMNLSTFSNNFSAMQGGGVASEGRGSIFNSTFSNNAAGTSGGGIYSSAPVRLERSTIAENEASGTGGGVFAADSLYFSNTLIASNRAPQGPELFEGGGGIIVSLGHNVVRQIAQGLFNPAAGDTIGTAANPVEAYLGPLQNNGGFTLTHLPLCGSPAIDRGDSTDAPAYDQRGQPRVYGSNMDIGSVESQTDPVEIRAVINHESAPGMTDGFIQLAPTGGTPPYFYRWYNGSQNSSLTNLAAGSYSVTVSDNDSCQASAVFTILLANSVDEAGRDVNLTMFPMPAERFVFIAGSTERAEAIMIFDVCGRLLKKMNDLPSVSEQIAIDVAGLPNGCHLMVVKYFGGLRAQGKLLKISGSR